MFSLIVTLHPRYGILDKDILKLLDPVKKGGHETLLNWNTIITQKWIQWGQIPKARLMISQWQTTEA